MSSTPHAFIIANGTYTTEFNPAADWVKKGHGTPVPLYTGRTLHHHDGHWRIYNKRNHTWQDVTDAAVQVRNQVHKLLTTITQPDNGYWELSNTTLTHHGNERFPRNLYGLARHLEANPNIDRIVWTHTDDNNTTHHAIIDRSHMPT